MSTPRGEFNRRIAFERGVTVRSGLGREPAAQWASLGTVWAKVLFGTGQERRQAGAEGASQTATFRVLSSLLTRGVTERDRIQFDGRAWDITSISPIGVRDEIEFVATGAKG